jgi:hypothetical protein
MADPDRNEAARAGAGRAGPGRRRYWLWLPVAAAAVVAAWCLSLQRSGLYNNRGDDAAALREHQAAWRRHGWGAEMNRLDLVALPRSYDGSCITGEANWSEVRLERRLDEFVLRERLPVECRFRLMARWPKNLLRTYTWTTILAPISENRLRIVETRRYSALM